MALVDRQTIIIIILIFIFLLPNQGEEPQSSDEREVLQTFQNELKHSRQQLFDSELDLGYGNITGYQLSYADHISGKNESNWPIHQYSKKHPWLEKEDFSILPNSVSEKVKSFWGTNTTELVDTSYLLNVSGRAFGEFAKENITPVKLGIPTYVKNFVESYSRKKWEEEKRRYQDDPENNPEPPDLPNHFTDKVGNTTIKSGKISLKIENVDQEDTSINGQTVSVRIKLQDYDEVEDHEFDTRGIYFRDTGSLVTVSKSAKFFGYHGLPHLTFLASKFATSKMLMSQLLNSTDIDREIKMDDLNSYALNAYQRCEIVSYIQFEKTVYTQEQLRIIDKELKTPNGRPIPSFAELPKLQIKDYLIYSPDCGAIFGQTPETSFEGLKSDVLNISIKHLLVGILLLSVSQLWLLLRQMKEVRTPGDFSAVSSKTLGIIALQDSTVALTMLLVSAVVDDLYLLFISITIILAVMCGIFEVRFIMHVVNAQLNESGSTWWEILRGGLSSTIVPPASGTAATVDTETAEAAVPAAPVPTPAPVPALSIEDYSRVNGLLAMGFTMSVIATFLVFSALTWRTKFRRVFEYMSLIAINTIWVPQFLRNTLKNRRAALTWEYVLGTSLIRLAPVAYFCLLGTNPLRHRFDPVLFLVVTCWITIQLSLLYLQSRMGPRFWLNEKWLPQAYDYQVVLSIKDLEAGGGFGSDLLANINQVEEQDGVVSCKSTCSICMADVDVPILVDSSSKLPAKIDTTPYMVTPCHHIFHSECLQSWMKYKLQCPVCRESLPPL